MNRFDVCVRGNGVVAGALALALARQGSRIGMQADAAQPPHPDVRAYALNAASVAFLDSLGLWGSLAGDAKTPVYDMRIRGDAAGGRLEFSAYRQRVRELAWIVDAAELQQQLGQALDENSQVTSLGPDDDATASLLALAEGRDSASRESLGVTLLQHNYAQTAIAARLSTEQAHQNVAHQWFRQPDVLALLAFDRPRVDHSYALVWSLPEARAGELMALPAADFECALHDATRGECGNLRLAGERAAWPLRLARAQRWCGPGWVLLGDAAHVVHPLAGQGLNLGLADVQSLVRVVTRREPWREPGEERLLRRYARERALPTRAMQQVTDGLLQLFASEAPAVRELRNRGLTLVNHLSPVKRWLTARALDS